MDNAPMTTAFTSAISGAAAATVDIDMMLEEDMVEHETAMNIDTRAYVQGEAAFPASAPLPNGAQVQEQEVAALAHVLRDVNVRIHALKGVLIARDGPSHELQVSPQDAGRTGPSMFAQCQEQTETITALRETASALQACVTVRDAEIDALNERLFLVQRELDQSRRESAAQVKHLRGTSDRLRGVVQSIRLQVKCPLCSRDKAVTHSYPCSHAVCEACAENWWHEQRREGPPGAKCPVCRSLTGLYAARGVPVGALQTINDIV